MTTKIVINTDSDVERDIYFPLESRMAALSAYKNTYIMVVFDCCREEKPKPVRGGGMADEVTLVEGSNFYCIFGCPPSFGVPVESTIAVNFKATLMKYLNETGGVWDHDADTYFREVQKKSSFRVDTT
jgi:hypothetical protein